MAYQTFFDRLSEQVRRFRTAERGHVVMTFALATVPIMGFVGSAVDYSRANSAKTAMQSAIDSTALMLSKTVTGLTQEQINQKASDYFNALFNRTDVTNITVTPVYTTTDGAQIVLTGRGTVATTFMNVVGLSKLDIDASSTVKWGNTRLRVALVLDVTGSMNSAGKITALKTATKSLLTQLQTAAVQNGDVYVSIVPFAKDVNVGGSKYNETWIDWTEWDANNGNCTNYGNGNKPKTQSSCLNKSGTWTAANHNTWNGCMTDRGDTNAPSAQNYDTNVALPVNSVAASRYPAEQYDSCPLEMSGLSYNWSAMTTLVNNMSPNGNTNQGIGLSWGWLTLVGGGVFTIPAKDPKFQYTEAIILFTDGLNTENRWYTNQTSIDDREKITCANAKAAGIILYTVQVNTGGDTTSQILKNCASDSSKFFILTSASEIISTFNQIGTALSNLRVAK
jgi:Flp pilus assembly protein TadG